MNFIIIYCGSPRKLIQWLRAFTLCLYIWRLDSESDGAKRWGKAAICGVFWFHKYAPWNEGGRQAFSHNIISYRGIIVWDHQGGSYKRGMSFIPCHSWNCLVQTIPLGFPKLILIHSSPRFPLFPQEAAISQPEKFNSRDRRKDIERKPGLSPSLYTGNIKGVSWIYSHNERRTQANGKNVIFFTLFSLFYFVLSRLWFLQCIRS